MTPVAAFAAVVAMAGPQRLAAESSIDETAGDLAAFSVVPDGVRMGSEQVARLNQATVSDLNPCGGEFDPPPAVNPARTVFTN